MTAKIRFLIGICWLISHAVKAQTNQPAPVKNRFALQAGLNYSLTTVHQPTFYRFLGLNNKFGYYLGGTYSRQWSSGLILRFAADYQQKGVSTANPFNLSSRDANYTYLSLTSCVGFEPVRKVSLLAGPQISKLIYTQNALGNASSIEFGLVAMIAYQIKKNQFNVGYFGGLTPYDRFEPIEATFYNQNWSVGVLRYVR